MKQSEGSKRQESFNFLYNNEGEICMGKNIKINNSEPCLCGSGKKFKDC